MSYAARRAGIATNNKTQLFRTRNRNYTTEYMWMFCLGVSGAAGRNVASLISACGFRAHKKDTDNYLWRLFWAIMENIIQFIYLSLETFKVFYCEVTRNINIAGIMPHIIGFHRWATGIVSPRKCLIFIAFHFIR